MAACARWVLLGEWCEVRVLGRNADSWDSGEYSVPCLLRRGAVLSPRGIMSGLVVEVKPARDGRLAACGRRFTIMNRVTWATRPASREQETGTDTANWKLAALRPRLMAGETPATDVSHCVTVTRAKKRESRVAQYHGNVYDRAVDLIPNYRALETLDLPMPGVTRRPPLPRCLLVEQGWIESAPVGQAATNSLEPDGFFCPSPLSVD